MTRVVGEAIGAAPPLDEGGRWPIASARQKRSAALYRSELAERARKLALLGLDDVAIAGHFGVSMRVMRDWLATFPELGLGLAAGRLDADADVVEGLHRRATGYEYPTTRFIVTRDGIEERQLSVHVPPDPRACELWLTNRQSERWRSISHQKIEASVDLTVSGASAMLEYTREMKRIGAPPDPVKRAA